MRKVFVAGNWKMNLDRQAAVELASGLADKVNTDEVRVAVCPPFVYLLPVAEVIAGSKIELGAQDVYFQGNGAFTGEISTDMLKDACCKYVIVGHSERRHVIGESDELINKKLKAVIAAGLWAIFCIGEKIEQRDAGQTEQVLDQQLTAGLAGLDETQLSTLVIAYEPVWAIGTGRNATPQQAQEAHSFIRRWLADKYSRALADDMIIQYGGSVKAANAADLIGQADVDGALVGGASLKLEEFAAIISAATAAKGTS